MTVVGSDQFIIAPQSLLQAYLFIYHLLHCLSAFEAKVDGRPDAKPRKRLTLTSSIPYQKGTTHRRSSQLGREKAAVDISQLKTEIAQER